MIGIEPLIDAKIISTFPAMRKTGCQLPVAPE
jgi:hypothetical protein